MKSRALLPYAGLLVLALAAGVLVAYLSLGRRHGPPPQTAALVLREPKSLPDFALTDTEGKTLDRKRLAGHWSLLYFGYTHCPDACPTTLAALDHMLARLGKLPADKRPQVYFISVDPKRDDPTLLKNYTLYFNPAFTGATGSLDALRALTAPLQVDFSYGKPDDKGNYGVDHSAQVTLVDPDTEEVALFTPPLEPSRMAADYLAILKYYGETL